MRSDWTSRHSFTSEAHSLTGEEDVLSSAQYALRQSGLTKFPFLSGTVQLRPENSRLVCVMFYDNGELINTLQLRSGIIEKILKHGPNRADTRLEDALQDLHEAREEAREEEFPEPSGTAIANAERLLRAMYEISPQRFEVYPTPDGEIAIDAPGGYGESVLLLCESSGGALCMVDVNGEHRRARYGSTRTLPDGFIGEALRELTHAASQPR